MPEKIWTFDQSCTCGVDDGDEGHSEDCDLFHSSEWLDGYATWYKGELWDTEELWGWGDDAQLEVPLEGGAAKPAGTSDKAWDSGWGDYYGATGGAGPMSMCDHDGKTPVTYPDGTLIYPSSSYAKTKDFSVPDYALYLETNRTPYSAAGYIPWRDYGLPTINFHHAAEMIIDAWEMATDGLTVEVGCIGAHGRTGTVLACMAILAEVPLDEAVDWVRANHCDKAVECEDQRWFVAWFHAYVHHLPAPPTPPEKPAPPPLPKAKGSSTTTVTKGQGSFLAPVEPCPNCKADLNAFDLEGFLCWNQTCAWYHTKADSPAARKLLKKSGRKKRK